MIPSVELTYNKFLKNQRPSVIEIENSVKENCVGNRINLKKRAINIGRNFQKEIFTRH